MFNAKEFIQNSLKEIAESVGDSRVISACSGGVDSTVATYLVHKAMGDKLVAVFIDDGLTAGRRTRISLSEFLKS